MYPDTDIFAAENMNQREVSKNSNHSNRQNVVGMVGIVIYPSVGYVVFFFIKIQYSKACIEIDTYQIDLYMSKLGYGELTQNLTMKITTEGDGYVTPIVSFVYSSH